MQLIGKPIANAVKGTALLLDHRRIPPPCLMQFAGKIAAAREAIGDSDFFLVARYLPGRRRGRGRGGGGGPQARRVPYQAPWGQVPREGGWGNELWPAESRTSPPGGQRYPGE